MIINTFLYTVWIFTPLYAYLNTQIVYDYPVNTINLP